MSSNMATISSSTIAFNNENNYLDSLETIYRKHVNGEAVRKDRTGTGTYSVFGELDNVYDLTFNDTMIVPMLTSKYVSFHNIKHELIWMLSGDTNIQYLLDNNVTIWNEWADENGDLNKVYGHQWRKWEDTLLLKGADYDRVDSDQEFCDWLDKSGYEFVCEGTGVYVYTRNVDQIKVLEHSLRTNPMDRGHIVSAWNAGQLNQMNLRPCHAFWQVYLRETENGQVLDMIMYQRSADDFLGVPYNIVFYSVLCHMLAETLGIKAGKFFHKCGDVHIYANHVNQVSMQLEREPIECVPTLVIPKKESILDYTADDIKIVNYKSHSPIKAPVAV